MLRIKIYIHLYIILDFPITYENASVICQPDCACLHKTVNMEIFYVKSNEITYPKGRALMQMYRVVPITKRGTIVGVHIYKGVNVYCEFGDSVGTMIAKQLLDKMLTNKGVIYLISKFTKVVTDAAYSDELIQKSIRH